MCSLSKFCNLSSKRNVYSRLQMEEIFYSKEHVQIESRLEESQDFYVSSAFPSTSPYCDRKLTVENKRFPP